MWVVAIGAVGAGDGAGAGAGAAARYPKTKDRTCPSLVLGFWQKMVCGEGWFLDLWVVGCWDVGHAAATANKITFLYIQKYFENSD